MQTISRATAGWRAFAYPAAFALLFAGTLVSSLFFNGVHIEYFALSGALFTLLTLVVLWRGYGEGFRAPRSLLAAALTLFWAWLALGLLWSRVPYVSMVNFWWVGSFVLIFWLATLTPRVETVWRWTAGATLLVVLFLAGMGLYQYLVLHSDPRSTFLSRNSHAALLMLAAIPMSVHYLQVRGRLRHALAGLCLFFLLLSIAITGSRGVMLSLLLAVVLVTAIAWRHVSGRRLAAWYGMLLGAYVLANVLLEGWLVGRLGTVFDPSEVGHDRLLIWKQALKMALDAPWIGVGLGTFWLHWPPYRDPSDSSAGFYVHNDYLQLWIETGLPGLLLLLAVELAVVLALVRTLRGRTCPPAACLELTGLVGGLGAIAFHTFFDFDFYIHPILLMIGLMLARIQYLYATHADVDILVLQPARRVGRRAFYTITLLLLVFPLLYFATLGVSARLIYQAREHVAQSRWVDASAALSRAWQLMPTSDLTLVSHADLLRQAIPALPQTDTALRQTLYREALVLLADAERVNPLRPQTSYIRGMLYQQNPDLAGVRWAEFAAESYRQTLRIDPRALWARMSYAQLLLAQGRLADARAVLDEGIGYWYVPEPQAFAYYSLTAQLHRQSGDHKGAAALLQKLDHLQRAARVRTDPFGSQPKPIQPEPKKP